MKHYHTIPDDVVVLSKEPGEKLWPKTFESEVEGRNVIAVTASIEILGDKVYVVPRVVHLQGRKAGSEIDFTNDCSLWLKREILLQEDE